MCARLCRIAEVTIRIRTPEGRPDHIPDTTRPIVDTENGGLSSPPGSQVKNTGIKTLSASSVDLVS